MTACIQLSPAFSSSEKKCLVMVHPRLRHLSAQSNSSQALDPADCQLSNVDKEIVKNELILFSASSHRLSPNTVHSLMLPEAGSWQRSRPSCKTQCRSHLHMLPRGVCKAAGRGGTPGAWTSLGQMLWRQGHAAPSLTGELSL